MDYFRINIRSIWKKVVESLPAEASDLKNSFFKQFACGKQIGILKNDFNIKHSLIINFTWVGSALFFLLIISRIFFGKKHKKKIQKNELINCHWNMSTSYFPAVFMCFFSLVIFVLYFCYFCYFFCFFVCLGGDLKNFDTDLNFFTNLGVSMFHMCIIYLYFGTCQPNRGFKNKNYLDAKVGSVGFETGVQLIFSSAGLENVLEFF